MTKLQDLTYPQYCNLKDSGLMFEVYPEATGDYDKDIPNGKFEVPEELSEAIEITIIDKEFSCGFKSGWGMIDSDRAHWIQYYESGAITGGTTRFWRRGETRLQAFTAFYNRIKNNFIIYQGDWDSEYLDKNKCAKPNKVIDVR